MYEFDCFRLDPEARVLLRDGEPMSIGPKIFDLLVLLVTNAGRAVDRLELVATLWGEDSHADGANLNQAVWLLRKVLGPHGAARIETVPRKGYRFNGSLQVLPVADSGGHAVTVSEASGRNEPVARPETPWMRRRAWVLGAAVAAAVVVAGALGWVWPHGDGSAPVARPVESVPRLAVVGFKSLSGSSETEWISTALAHMLTVELARDPMLHTVPIEAMEGARTELGLVDAGSLSPGTLQKLHGLVGMNLAVVGTYVVSGSLEDDIRVDLRVQDVSDGEVVLATSREAALSELSELVASLRDELCAKLGTADERPGEAE